MEVAIAFLGIAGSIVLTVVTLTLFFRGLDWLTRKVRRVANPKLPRRHMLLDVLDPETPITIHLVGEGELRDVHYLGALPDEFDKTGAVPHELRSFVVLGHPDGSRSLIRPKSIKSIDAPPPPS